MGEFGTANHNIPDHYKELFSNQLVFRERPYTNLYLVNGWIGLPGFERLQMWFNEWKDVDLIVYYEYVHQLLNDLSCARDLLPHYLNLEYSAAKTINVCMFDIEVCVRCIEDVFKHLDKLQKYRDYFDDGKVPTIRAEKFLCLATAVAALDATSSISRIRRGDDV